MISNSVSTRRVYSARLIYVSVASILSILGIIFIIISNRVTELHLAINNRRVTFHSIQRANLLSISVNINISLWRVRSSDGIEILRSPESTGAVLNILPQDSIIIGTLSRRSSKSIQSHCEYDEIYIRVTYPLSGWVYSGFCEQDLTYEFLQEIREEEKVISFYQDPLKGSSQKIFSSVVSPCDPTAYMLNTDLKGGDIEDFPIVVNSEQECCTQCLHRQDCTGWTFVSGVHCWLKHNGYEISTNQNDGPATKVVGLAPGKIPNGIQITSGILSYKVNKESLPSHQSLSDMDSNDSCETAELSSVPHCCLKDPNIIMRNSNIIRRLSPTLDWTSQFPIGTGRLGGLVGGIADIELIPLSISGFFVTRESKVADSSRDILNEKERRLHRKTELFTSMTNARNAYLLGNKKDLHGNLSAAIRRSSMRLNSNGPASRVPLSGFEYLADMTILFGIPLRVSPESQSSSSGGASSGGPQIKIPPDIENEDSGRMGVVKRIYNKLFTSNIESTLTGILRKWSKDKINKRLDAESFVKYKDISELYLDTSRSTVMSTYLSTYQIPDSNKSKELNTINPSQIYHHLQRREWFASVNDDVICGHFSGVYFRKNNSVDDHSYEIHNNLRSAHLDVKNDMDNGVLIRGAQDIIFSLTRPKSDGGVRVDHKIVPIEDLEGKDYSEIEHGIVLDDILNATTPDVDHCLDCGADTKNRFDRSSAYALESVISSGVNTEGNIVHAPNVVLCALVVCTRYSNGDRNTRSDYSVDTEILFTESESELVSCLSVDEAHLYISSEIGQSTYDASNKYNEVDDVQKLKSQCWNRVKIASYKGLQRLKSEHISYSQEKFNDLAQVSFDKHESISTDKLSNYSRCMDETYTDRFQQVESTCKYSESNTTCRQISTTDVTLLSQFYSFSLYLMRISSSKSVSNLQGIWADGPTSAWSGDYHLNINLQMNYWAFYSTGLAKDAINPLYKMIQKISDPSGPGSVAANELYDCPGWVTHGFTDQSLRSHMMGDAMWSLCVTCGAWLSLHMWDGISHGTDPFRQKLNYIVDIVNSKYLNKPIGRKSSGQLTELITDILHSESDLTENAIIVFRGVADFFEKYLWRDAQGIYHSGPTTSPENSYRSPFDYLKKQGPSFGATEYITMSPAIDISVLRQVANAYLLSSTWFLIEINNCIQALAVLMNIDGAEEVINLVLNAKSKLQELQRIITKDTKKALSFKLMIQKMPGEAIPSLERDPSEHGLYTIAEYPGPMPGGTSNPRTSSLSNVISNKEIHFLNHQSASEELIVEDKGHRHWSSMHWLYPSSFVPFSIGANFESNKTAGRLLKIAAIRSMLEKCSSGGGHTGWSAIWGSSLWARLGESDHVWTLIKRTIQSYRTENFMGLHPSLQQKDFGDDCETCFYDISISPERLKLEFPLINEKKSLLNATPSKISPSIDKHILNLRNRKRNVLLSQQFRPVSPSVRQHIWSEYGIQEATSITTRNRQLDFNVFNTFGLSRPERGLVTADGSKFQIDVNGGILATIHEVLIQSHAPGLFSLLPALPAQLNSGSASRIRCRGDVLTSFKWTNGHITAIEVLFQQRHPWLYLISEDAKFPGFFSSPNDLEASNSSNSVAVTLDFPNEVNIVSSTTSVYTGDNEHFNRNRYSGFSSCARMSSGKSYKKSPANGHSDELNIGNNNGVDRYCLRLLITSFPCSVTLKSPII